MTGSRALLRWSSSSSDDDELIANNPLFPALAPRRPLPSLAATSALTLASTVDARGLFGDHAAPQASPAELDPTVLELMADAIAGGAALPDGGDRRFKYLSWYQHYAQTTATPTSNDDALVFHLRHLDDYHRYVRQTELNTWIGHQMPSDKLKVLTTTEGIPDHFCRTEEPPTRPPPTYRTYSKKLALFVGTDDITSGADTPYSAKSDTDAASGLAPLVYLQRRLKIRHLQMISFGGTLGVGLFLNSGKAINIAGGFGAFLAFLICGLIVIATLVLFCEMVTLVLVVDGVLGLLLRFIDDAFGFAVGWLYFLSFAVGLAGETVACVILLSYYPWLHIHDNAGSAAGFVTLFLLVTVAANLMDVRVFGEIEYISLFIKLLCALGLIILMIVINVGGMGGSYIGFRYWDHAQLDFAHNLIYGLFRPTFNLFDDGSNVYDGVGGARGRFMAFIVALLVTLFAYLGTEIVCIAACEAQNPRKALPSATKRVFLRIIIFYVLAVFVVSLNVYAGDPRLLRYYLGQPGVSESDLSTNPTIEHLGGNHCGPQANVFAGFPLGSQLPWNIALQSVNQCTAGGIVNGFLVFFAVSCGNSQIYVLSRTAYSLALQGKAPKMFGWVNRYGIPYVAVLFLLSFGLLSYICVSEKATTVFQNLTLIILLLGIMVWFAMCLLFVRFYYGLKRRPDIIARDDKEYPYKLPFQPYTAIFGMVGLALILLAMGYVVFLGGTWDTWFFFSLYGLLFAFAVLYLGYKVIKRSHIPALERLDFDTGRTEMDRYIWDKGREYNGRSFKDTCRRFANWIA